jgi:uncharacterized phiE125 gp8 family phage protein
MVGSQGIAREFDLSTAPTSVAVQISDLRAHLRYLSTDQDDLIGELESMAVERVENESRRQLVNATWKMYLPCFTDVISIRKSPVSSITQIRYVDTGGDWQVLATSVYDSFLQREPAEIRLAYSQAWPATRGTEQAVEVTFVAGYGTSEDIPSIAIHAIKLMVQDAFEGTDKNEPAIERLMAQLNWGM